MSFMRRKSRHLSERVDDSFVVSDSDEEGAAGRTQYNFDLTHRDTRVIGDSDTESEISKNRDSKGNSEKNKTLDSDESETLDSEDEDLRFMNHSQRVSIIVNSSEESESEPEKEKVKSNKFKRRSIYDNLTKSESEDELEEENFNSNKFKRRSVYNNLSTADTPTSISTPINIRKRPKRAVMYSDSESEGLADVHTKTPLVTKNQKHFIDSIDKDKNNDTHFEGSSNDSKSNEMETSDGSNYQECSNNSDGFNREKERRKQFVNDIMSDKLKISKATDKNTHSNVKGVFANDKSKLQYSNMDSDSELEISETSTDNSNRVGTDTHSKERSPLKERKLNAKNVVDLTHDTIHDNSTKQIDISKGKENIVDLTLNESGSNSVNRSINKSLQKEEKSSAEEIIISSSASASESEIDLEALALARKEIGVGNIDFLEAQKKEHLLLNIENAQKQLDKLNKFAASVDINKLPDKGVKVHETIKAQEEKLKSLKLKLAKLPGKNTMNTPRKLETPKTKTQPRMETKRSFISPLVDRTNSVKKEPKMEQDLKFSNQFDKFDVHDIPDVPQTAFDTADLGKQALATLNKQQSLTHHRLEQLHGSLTSRPTEDQKERDPSGLKVALMGHQQHALAWMKWREKQKPKGGILADDMGLGKTLTMISLILATVDQRANDSDESSSDEEWLSRKKHKRYYGGTLVVCPASLIKQWEAEVKNRVKRGLLSVLVFHGNNRSMEDRKLSKYNIVVTTYQILVREADSETGMYKMEWNRIILDEAHYIRNHKSKACLAVCGLNAKHRWALTGTPIQNKEMDLYAILKFLKCSPFDDLQVWKRWVDNKNDAGKQRLITIMKTMMLRRTKQELHSKGNLDSLPEKFSELIEIEMDREEDLVYKKILLFSQNLFAQFLAQRADKQHTKDLYGGKFDRPSLSSLGSKTQFTKAQKMLLDHHSNVEAHEILVLLLRLRQMCCHPALIHAMLDKQDAELNGIDDQEDANADLLNKLHNMSINEDEEIDEHVANFKIDERVAANLLTKKNRVFNDDRQSSKVRAILRTVEKIVEKGDKVIIVSQWTSFLKVIAKNLDDIDDANYAMFTGEVAVKNRQAIVDKLNSQGDEINILLLSLTAGGVGLNLVGANHLLLTDIHWNPQLEAQAQDRIYRFGQKKNVFIYKFICKETIEERVKNLQDKKLDIANHVLTGTRSVSSKLTIEDLKLLFS